MSVSAEQLKIEELRLRYLDLIQRPEVFPTRANWEFITAHAMHGLGHALYRKYLMALTIGDADREELHDIAIEEFPKYLRVIPRQEAVDVMYSDFSTAPEASLELIREAGLFDADSLIEILNEKGPKLVMALLDVYQPDYSEADVEPMKALLSRLENLPLRGGIQEVSGVFGSSKKYVCPNGHKNSPEVEYCSHSGCGLNAHGLTKEQVDAVEHFRLRIRALISLL